MNSLCPLCQTELKVEESEIDARYPSYRCPVPYDQCFRKTHYIKYHEADWTYSRYREEAYVHPYRIVNNHDDRDDGRSGKLLCFIQEEKMVRQGLMMSARLKYVNILTFARTLNIPNQDHFITKIKTLLVFS